MDDGQEEVSREIIEVKLVPPRVIENSPEDDGDEDGERGGDVGEDPEKGAENGQSFLVTSLTLLAIDNVHVFVKFFSLHKKPAGHKESLDM